MWAVFDEDVPSSWSVGGRMVVETRQDKVIDHPVKPLYLCRLSGIGGRVVDFFDIACVPVRARVRVCVRGIIRSLSLSDPIDFRELYLVDIPNTQGSKRLIRTCNIAHNSTMPYEGQTDNNNASLDVCPYTLFLQSEVGLLDFYLLQQTVALIF